MNIVEIAKYAWAHSHPIRFGLAPTWDPALFTGPWAKAQNPTLDWNSFGPGWYWFSVTMSYSEIHDVRKPPTLPQNGCDIGSLSHANSEIFGCALLCQPDDQGAIVVYNGHEGNVAARVRAHFALNNDRTGALGLKHFALSHLAWEVRVFSSPCLNKLSAEDKARFQLLMNSKSGRCAVETAWRAEYGWPVLCKQ